ncbi:MAG: 3-dehydroquinate synthase [Chloroflexi bacterium]|nr:3-dehydroquinate synthase [Chloroflexota bacterium]
MGLAAAAIGQDIKRQQDRMRFILPRTIGDVVIDDTVTQQN